MLRWRFILGTLLVAALLGLFWVDHTLQPRGMVLLPIACLLAMLATGELLRMFAMKGHPLPRWISYVTVLIPILSSASSLWTQRILYFRFISSVECFVGGILVSILGLVFWHLMHFEGAESSTSENRQALATHQLALGILNILYVGGGLGSLVLLRTIHFDWTRRDIGLLALGSLIAVVKLGDTGAYTVGRLMGKHKMAPKLSPGKTWEGTIGGLVWSCVGAYLLVGNIHWWFPSHTDWEPFVSQNWLLYGLLVGTAGVCGDLLESLLKRESGVKDSSTWLPGFGGVLDILDSLLLAAPVAFLFFRLSR